MFSFKFKFLFFFFVPVFIWFIFTPSVFAADPKPTIRDEGYVAKYVDQSVHDPIVIKAGETRTVDIRFKNVGTKSWVRGGKHVSAYTEVPRDRDSVFFGSNWVGSKQTALMEPKVVNPGEIGTLSIDLKAPNKSGTYVEEFYLAAENVSWIKGGYFFLKIKVEGNSVSLGDPSVASTPPAGGSDLFPPEADTQDDVRDVVEEGGNAVEVLKARKAMLSKSNISAVGGEQVKLVVGFLNEGSVKWDKYALIANRPELASTGPGLSTFADESWKSNSVIKEQNKIVDPNGLFRETIYFRAPREKGIHTFTISPMVNGKVLAASADVVVTVTEDAPDHYEEPLFSNNVEIKQIEPRLKNEPRIRVGVAKNPVELGEVFRFRPLDDAMNIFDGEILRGVLDNKVMGSITANVDGSYYFKGGDIEFTTNQYIRAAPQNDPHATFLTLNYSRRVSWRGSMDFNIYRGALEYRKTNDGNDNYYFINDLLFEDYTAGIAEASNGSPIEFLKAQAVVARTYAYYIQKFSNKHNDRFFDVVATTGDQLYLGYNNEGIASNYILAVRETKGYMVTYDGNVVITPYFGHSNGKTKSWQSVWGGTAKPWLVPVVAEYDSGRAQYGHGVGMSQRDASIRADKEGVDFIELLKHYYTGVSLEIFYK